MNTINALTLAGLARRWYLILLFLGLGWSGCFPLNAQKDTSPSAATQKKPTAQSASSTESGDGKTPPVTVSSLLTSDLADFTKQPESIQQLIESCLLLTRRNLGYQMGSADPSKGGMDCSGTIYHVLQQLGRNEVPRQANEQYRWVWEKGWFRAFNGSTVKSFELAALKPGDLLFWVGTYDTDKRDPPVSHVMIYLGKTKKGARSVMFGASEGRTYLGKPQNGVSVFDFRLPAEGAKARFIGYAPVLEAK